MSASTFHPADSGWRWLDRHIRGWGLVRIVREDEPTGRIVLVYDPEAGDEYAARRSGLHILGPKAKNYQTADEAARV